MSICERRYISQIMRTVLSRFALLWLYQRPHCAVQWRHHEHDGVSNHQPNDCLLNRLFRCRLKKHQGSASLAFVREIRRSTVNSPPKGPVTRKMFPFDDVIMVWDLFNQVPQRRFTGNGVIKWFFWCHWSNRGEKVFTTCTKPQQNATEWGQFCGVIYNYISPKKNCWWFLIKNDAVLLHLIRACSLQTNNATCTTYISTCTWVCSWDLMHIKSVSANILNQLSIYFELISQ